MIKEIISTGKDVDEAVSNAKLALGTGPEDDVKYEILEMGSKGIFGIIGVKPTKIRAYIELPDTAPQRARAPRSSEKAGSENQNNRSENRDRGNRNRSHNRGKGSERRAAEAREMAQAAAEGMKKPSTPKEAVIPEAELHFTKMEVAEGEDRSLDFVRQLIANLGLQAQVELFSCEDGSRRITINGEDASMLIGHHGDTLDALQYLANLASAKKNINNERLRSRVTIDIEGYRAKREETLRALARRMSEKALRNHKSVMLEPMSAYERRIIHSEVQGIEGVATNSIGSDNNRKIVIYLTDKKAPATESAADSESTGEQND